MKHTSLLCLSSPEGDANYYSELMNIKHENGEDFFVVINCFQICERCQKLGKNFFVFFYFFLTRNKNADRVKAMQCKHVKSTAHWLSSRKIRELKQLYKASPEDAIREFGGIVVSDYKPALRKEEVDAFFKSIPLIRTHSPKLRFFFSFFLFFF
jgi:hypothetical protein